MPLIVNIGHTLLLAWIPEIILSLLLLSQLFWSTLGALYYLFYYSSPLVPGFCCVGYVDHCFFALLDFICTGRVLCSSRTVLLAIAVRCTPEVLHRRVFSVMAKGDKIFAIQFTLVAGKLPT